MKKAIAWLLVLSLTAAISIGATLAYLTDTDEDVNVMTVGKVKIDQLEYERINDETSDKDAAVQEFHNNKPLYPAVTDKEFDYTPGDTYVDWTQIGKDGYTSEIWNPENINNELDKMVFVKNKGTYDAYVRTVFAFEAGKYTTADEFKSMMHLNLNDTDWEWEWLEKPVAIPNDEGTTTNYFIAVATYNEKLAPGAITEISLSQIALDSTATNADVEAFGDTYQILVKSQAIQADGFDVAAAALDDGFGVIITANIPWESDAPAAGTTMRNALHYLNADPTGTKITTQVVNVIFGKTTKYADIADEYDGVLITDGQDVAVRAYYVPNGSKYDVYFLANSTIYAPEDSSELFIGMSSLVKVDTVNFDVSRVTNMYKMFRDCTSLSTIDVGDWDTSRVTNMGHMFRACLALEWIDVGQWDTGNVTAFNSMFSDSKSNRAWMKINNLDFSNWDMSSATNIGYMFYGCGQLTELDLSNWDVSKVTTVNHMFSDCFKMQHYNFSGWNTASLQTMNAMFNSNKSLQCVDVSDIDTGNVNDFGQVFDGCTKLEQIIGLDTWDTSKGVDFGEFLLGSNMKEIDLSAFNMSSAKYTQNMFHVNPRLTTIYVGDNWNLNPEQIADKGMFGSSPKLTGANGSTVSSLKSNNALYARVDTPETPGLLTHIKDKP